MYSTDQFDDEHDIKNPFEQALASKYALIDWLKKDASMPHVDVGHGVIFLLERDTKFRNTCFGGNNKIKTRVGKTSTES